jgi:hypothetical protein
MATLINGKQVKKKTCTATDLLIVKTGQSIYRRKGI